jgi:hypothetical protein
LTIGSFGVHKDDADSYTYTKMTQALEENGINCKNSNIEFAFVDVLKSNSKLATKFDTNLFHQPNELEVQQLNSLKLCNYYQTLCVHIILEIRRLKNLKTVIWTLSSDSLECLLLLEKDFLIIIEEEYKVQFHIGKIHPCCAHYFWIVWKFEGYLVSNFFKIALGKEAVPWITSAEKKKNMEVLFNTIKINMGNIYNYNYISYICKRRCILYF